MEIGTNWYLKYRLAVEEVRRLEFELNVMKRKYENYNTRSTWNWKNYNVVESGGRIYKKRSKA
jgi:hypothetical protein